MGIYIKGMEMPQSCYDCVITDESYYCPFTHATDVYRKGRHPNCPLVSVPEPHGRLIDADDALIWFVCEGQRSKRYKIGEIWELNRKEINKVISSLRTIIPSSEEER